MTWKWICRHPCVTGCLRCIRWIPVLFIVSIICWSYYAYVYELCVCTVPILLEKVVYLILYHWFLMIFMWSYWQCTFAEIGRVPRRFHIPDALFRQVEGSTPSQKRQILAAFAKDLPLVTRTFDGCIRYCDRCQVVKPDRAHHCSICGFCVLKMDHHCPWVNTCVSYTNYKFFVLFLGYALTYCIYVALTDLRYFINFWTNTFGSDHDGNSGGKFHIMFLFFVAIMFSISVSVLFFYHLWLISKNRSTLEAFRPAVFQSGPDKDGFSLGCSGNFLEIFGTNRSLWFLPVFSSLGDGCTFPTRHCCFAPAASGASGPSTTNYQSTLALPSSSAHCLHTSLGDGISYPVRTYDLEQDGLLSASSNRWSTSESESDAEGSDAKLSANGEAFHLQTVVVR